VVKRFVRGKNQWAYMQERMDNRLWQNVEQAVCLDSALSYPQPAPNATLTASAAQGSGGVVLGGIIVGGSNFTAPSFTIVDAAGLGTGAQVVTYALSGGAVTSLTIAPGAGYVQPQLQVSDATGSGLIVSLIVDNAVTFTADQNVFDGVTIGAVGQVIRAGGGIGTVSAHVSSTEIIAQVPPQSSITALIPNDPNNMPVPQPSGSWTITTPIATVSGLEHLEGMTVNALADGFPITGLTVANSLITLPNAASQILIGLPFAVQAQSLDADLPGAMIHGKRKRLQGITVRLAGSGVLGLEVGQDQPVTSQQRNGAEIAWNVSPNFLSQTAPAPSLAGPGNAPPLFFGDIYLPVGGDYQTTDNQPSPGRAAVQQLLPLPVELLAFIPQAELGDMPDA
jgi:hypothetical protein